MIPRTFSPKEAQEQIERLENSHSDRVRLIRYKNFIEHQAKRGYKAGADWFKSGEDDLYYRGAEAALFIDYDSDFTPEQLVSLCGDFLQSFYFYVNFDNIMSGNAVGHRVGSNVDEEVARELMSRGLPEGFQKVQMDICLETFFRQIEEIEERYLKLRCPLGPELALHPQLKKSATKPKKGKKGKQNRDRGNNQQTTNSHWKTHEVEIDGRIFRLLNSLKANMLPTNCTARAVANISGMLSTAAMYDPAVAKSLIDVGEFNCGSLLLSLISKTSSLALETKDKQWLVSRLEVMNALGISVQSLLTKQNRGYAFSEDPDQEIDNPAAAFFFDKIYPELQPFFTSSDASERAAAFDCFERVCVHLPQTPLLQLICKKKTWEGFEKAVGLGMEQCKMSTSEAILSTWEQYIQHIALCNTTSVIMGLCG